MTLDLSRNELKKILKKAECCGTCKHNSHYDGIFHYCDLVRTKDGNMPCYPTTSCQVCKHWGNEDSE